MKSKNFVVRIIKASNKPVLPKINLAFPTRAKGKNRLSKKLNIFIGSGIGFAAGLLIFLMLKASGLNLGSLESSIIIGFPSVLGIFTSFAIF